MTFVLRTSANPMLLAPAARKAAAEIDPEIPLGNVVPLEVYTEAPFRDLFLYSLTLGLFAAVAASLAVMGIYAALAYAVAQRTHEIGIRISVGARSLAIVGLIGRWTAVVLGVGLLAGLAAGLALTRFLESQLWQVKPTDSASFILAGALLALAAAASCIVPVRRALQVDPTIALRSE